MLYKGIPIEYINSYQQSDVGRVPWLACVIIGSHYALINTALLCRGHCANVESRAIGGSGWDNADEELITGSSC